MNTNLKTKIDALCESSPIFQYSLARGVFRLDDKSVGKIAIGLKLQGINPKQERASLNQVFSEMLQSPDCRGEMESLRGNKKGDWSPKFVGGEFGKILASTVASTVASAAECLKLGDFPVMLNDYHATDSGLLNFALSRDVVKLLGFPLLNAKLEPAKDADAVRATILRIRAFYKVLLEKQEFMTLLRANYGARGETWNDEQAEAFHSAFIASNAELLAGKTEPFTASEWIETTFPVESVAPAVALNDEEFEACLSELSELERIEFQNGTITKDEVIALADARVA